MTPTLPAAGRGARLAVRLVLAVLLSPLVVAAVVAVASGVLALTR